MSEPRCAHCGAKKPVKIGWHKVGPDLYCSEPCLKAFTNKRPINHLEMKVTFEDIAGKFEEHMRNIMERFGVLLPENTFGTPNDDDKRQHVEQHTVKKLLDVEPSEHHPKWMWTMFHEITNGGDTVGFQMRMK